MSLNTTAVVSALESHASASGYFERVNGHETINAPGNGLSVGIWVQRIRPVALASGLAVTSARVEFTVRIYSSALQEPQDGIDPAIVEAADALFVAYGADFELGGNVRNVDLLGATGEPLSANAGWVTFNDGPTFRVMDILLPVVVNDVWTQSP